MNYAQYEESSIVRSIRVLARTGLLLYTNRMMSGGESRVQVGSERIPFEKLWPDTERILVMYLRKLGASQDDASDIASVTCQRVQAKLNDTSFETLGKWYAYCKITADNIRRKRFKRESRVKFIPLDEATLAIDQDFAEAIDNEIGTKRIQKAMSDMWLGAPKQDQGLRVLLATMVLVDGRSASEAIRVLRKSGKAEGSLAVYLNDQRTIGETAYRMLHKDPRHLTATVLGIPESEFTTLVFTKNSGGSYAQWRCEHIETALNRFCDFRPISELTRYVTESRKEEILATVATLEAELPFSKCMHFFLLKCGELNLSSGYVGTPGVWQRLAFEYKMDGLSSADFVSWFASSAELAKVKLTTPLVHSWTAGKRPLIKIREFLEAQQEKHGRS